MYSGMSKRAMEDLDINFTNLFDAVGFLGAFIHWIVKDRNWFLTPEQVNQCSVTWECNTVLTLPANLESAEWKNWR